jgi:hypothetical protein
MILHGITMPMSGDLKLPQNFMEFYNDGGGILIRGNGGNPS